MTKDRPDGVTLIGIFYFLKAAVTALGLVGVLIVLALLPASPFLKKFISESISAAAAITIAGLVAVIICIILFSFTILYLIVALGLLRLKKWARLTIIILSALDLYVFFPIGTILGAITIWYLFKTEVKEVFKD